MKTVPTAQPKLYIGIDIHKLSWKVHCATDLFCGKSFSTPPEAKTLYDYVQKNGQPGRWPLTGFSPRKAALTIYIMPGFENYADLMGRLGKYKNSVSCLYITRLANVDLDVLDSLVKKSVDDMKRIYHG